MTGVCSSADSPPTAEITNSLVRLRLYLPDAKTGFYRGTRFDWAGIIASAEYAGHDYFTQWFQRTDAKVHDFIYDGPDIVAGPCTAATGPAEEFASDGSALGFSEAKAGGSFIKIGVGVLRKPDDAKYDMFRLYEIVDGGKGSRIHGHIGIWAGGVVVNSSARFQWSLLSIWTSNPAPSSPCGYSMTSTKSLKEGNANSYRSLPHQVLQVLT
jgi:hypothetical protein